MDLFAMRICGAKKIPTHASVAASFGLFDVEKGDFKRDKLAILGIDGTFLPQVTKASASVGTYRGVPVAVAIGDNQASVLGSVRDNRTDVLVNVGTGAQVSVVGDYRETSGDTEVRPFVEGKHLICGSALCGGFAYALTECFFRRYVAEAGLGDAPQYETMNRLAREAYERGETGLDVETSFLGRRSDPSRRGSITEIGPENFTPDALILGVLNGMSAELHGLYTSFGEPRLEMIASGGGIKRNDLLRRLLADRFGMEILIPEMGEEAATGAALFAALAVGKIQYKNGFLDYIRYV
jgi:sedoheptulokinase